MPKPYARFAFKNTATDLRYNSDHVDKYSIVTRFVIPSHLAATWNNAKSTAVATAIGALPLDFTDATGAKVVINRGDAGPCAFGDLLVPRKIKFYFSNGTSASIAVGFAGTGIKTAYDALETAMIASGVTVDCAHLVGEKFSNLNDVAGVDFNLAEATSPAGSGPYYSGVLSEYVTEITGEVVPLRFKIMSTALSGTDRTFPPIFQAAGPDCMGAVGQSSYSCPRGASSIDTRRITVLYKSDANALSFESREIPVKQIGTGLKTCLEALAARPGVACISYRGEDRKNISLIA